MKEIIKVPRHWPLCGEFTSDQWIPHTRASNVEMFPFDDVIMATQLKHMAAYSYYVDQD